MTKSWMLAASLASAAACGAPPQPPRSPGPGPADAPTAYTAAVYHLDAGGQRVARAVIWSRGAQDQGPDPSVPLTAVLFEIEIENHSDEPLRLEPAMLRLDAIAVDGTRVTGVPAAHIQGEWVVPPDETETVGVHFWLSGEIEPRALAVAILHWSVVAADSARHVRRSAFVSGRDSLTRPRMSLYHLPRFDPAASTAPAYGAAIVWAPYRHR